MFAIQWALVICNVVSCLPAIPAFIYPIDSEKFHDAVGRFFDGSMPLEKDQPIIKLLFRFLFYGLTGIYVLGIFAGFYAPAVWVGYAFAIGNFLRVAFIGIKYADAETWALGNFSKKQIGLICIIQTVLGLVIAGCTFLSSTNEEYLAFAEEMADAAEAKWGTDGFFCKLIFGAGIFFTVFQLPPVLAPAMAFKQFQPVEAKQATDKGSIAVIDFVFAFQALTILMTQALVATFVWYAPAVEGLALWCFLFYVFYYPALVFCPVILKFDYYGMDPIPMLVFLIMNGLLGGVALDAYFS